MHRVRWIRIALIAAAVIVALPIAAICAFRFAAAARERESFIAAAPASGHFVRAADVQMFVQEAGPADGPPVLLVHGTGAWSEIWRRTLDTLASRGFHAVAIDMPPFGYSERPHTADYGDEAQARRILGVIDGMRLDRVTLVGHSFGGRPTMEAFFLDASRIARLVLVDGALSLDTAAAVRPPSAIMNAVFASTLIRNGLVSATLTNPMLTGRLLRGLVADPSAVTSERVAMLQKPFVRERTTVNFGEWLQPFATTHERSLATDRARYAAIQIPTLVIWGDLDSVTPIEQGRDLARLVPHAKLSVLSEVGHIPAIEATDRFNAALLAFLDTTGGAARR